MVRGTRLPQSCCCICMPCCIPCSMAERTGLLVLRICIGNSYPMHCKCCSPLHDLDRCLEHLMWWHTYHITTMTAKMKKTDKMDTPTLGECTSRICRQELESDNWIIPEDSSCSTSGFDRQTHSEKEPTKQSND